MKTDRIQRVLRLVTLLQTGRKHVARDLAGQLNVHRRTLFRDLNLLRAAGVPVAYDEIGGTYTIRRSFFLPPTSFTLAEVLALMMVLRKYGSREVLPNFSALAGATAKIESALPRPIQHFAGSAIEQINVRHAPTTDIKRAEQMFDLLWQSARKRVSVDITYDSYYEKREILTRLDPYRLMFIARAWYVIGRSSLHEQVRTFKIERIMTAVPTGETFSADPAFDPAAYFGNAWQMIRGDRRYHVRIRFSPKVARNVEEVLWHPTQQTLLLEDESMRYEVDVDGLDEIAWWILGYGKEAVVEAPAKLRTIIRDHVRAMAALYDGD